MPTVLLFVFWGHFFGRPYRSISMKFALDMALNVMINGKNFFDQSIKKKIATCQGDNYTTTYLLDYVYFKHYNKIIVTYLSKQQKLDAKPKVNQQISFTGNLDRVGNVIIFSLLKKQKKLF